MNRSNLETELRRSKETEQLTEVGMPVNAKKPRTGA